MTILFRYVFRQVLASSLVGGALFTFVLFLQQIGPVMELLVRARIEARDVGYILLLTMPQSLPYTIPMGVLLGVLVGLGRLSTDNEITAMRAAGVPSRRVITPIAAFCVLGTVFCGAITLKVNPWAAREFQKMADSLKISQATAEIQPRVFIENFPDKVLYVSDVAEGETTIQWEGLFLADTSAPESRGSVSGLNAAVDGPRITVADKAIVVPLPDQNRLQLHLPRATTFEQSFDPKQYQVMDYELGDQVIETEPDQLEGAARPLEQLATRELRRASREGDQQVEAGILLGQRFALPIACLVLPMVGIPLSISTQRTNRSVGVILAVALAFCYWMLLVGGTALAEQRLAPPQLSMWMANVVFAALGLRMLSQLDAPNRADWLALAGGRVRRFAARFRNLSETGEIPQFDERTKTRRKRRGRRTTLSFGSLFLLVDRYILRSFVFYFAVMLAAFISIWFVFSFFELLSDMLQRQKLGLFVPYLYYLTPFLVYETSPLAVMAATLVSFGLLAKHQELTAFRACGVSLYRLAAPILVAALSFSGLLFMMDHYYLPESNRRQDAIRDEIKGRPTRTFLRADRQWTFGQEDRIFYHEYFDYDAGEIGRVNVYDLERAPFRLTRHISAERAHWDAAQGAWVFENGWVRNIEGSDVVSFEPFESKAVADIAETPAYFRKEEKRDQQMNWRELRAYISDLTQAGFDTVELQVRWHRKFSFPLFAFAMALLALPFAVVAGGRGALSPAVFSLAMAVGYYALSALFEKLGEASQLTPALAAWAPALIFGFGGGYLLLRVRS